MTGGAPLAERLEDLRRRIRRASERSGRAPEAVRLIAVTKTHPEAVVREAARAGLADFGENRVQEAIRKVDALRQEFPGLRWHLIGRLQTNKAKSAVKYFQEIESVDRESLIHRLAAEARAISKEMPILLEINLGLEEAKGGVAAREALPLLKVALAESPLSVAGLMAVPPFGENPEAVRPYFRQLRELRDRLRDASGAPLPELSMGMSHDFEAAIEEGATTVRIGTALFGERR